MSVTENMLEFVPNSKCSEIVQQYVIGLRGAQSREMGVRDEVMLCVCHKDTVYVTITKKFTHTSWSWMCYHLSVNITANAQLRLRDVCKQAQKT